MNKKKEFDNAYAYYLWCKDVNKDDTDYDYFISLEPNAWDYYLWCRDISIGVNYNIFMSLNPDSDDYYYWCKFINKDDADYSTFISLKPTSWDYYCWCKDINKDDADYDYFIFLKPNKELIEYWENLKLPIYVNTLLLDKQEVESLKRLVVYVLEDEKKHYEEYEPEDRQNHIYKHIKILSSVLKD